MNDREYEKHSFERDEKVNHTGNDDDAKEEQSEREEVDEDKDLDSYNLANPLPPPDVDLDKLRGDRIGDTVYSGKWCIQTVIKLMQSNVVAKPEEFVEADEKIDLVDMEEELQNEVGVLWDMTSNVEVCQYLHSISAVESICYVINNSRCPRATEMCVGMLANIITHKELWEILKNDTLLFDLLIQLLSNTDQPVLLEVTRFLNTALCQPDNECCYARLCENGQNVTCELLRILSGSTNADLLKHAAELIYNLMYIDDGETNFCAFFASDPEFVLAVVEASKELGYEHDSSGQNYLMEIFHCFTTYDAGILAIENCMDQIAETSSAYLKSLCKNVNLNSNSTIMTTIIATLNHIFCRNVMVRLGLISLTCLYLAVGHNDLLYLAVGHSELLYLALDSTGAYGSF
ncbi:Protein saal1 [Bulinus truncatus]|nr:Protein saal1 [Bulinus truncatus]